MQLEQLNLCWNDLHVQVYSFRLFYVRILCVDISFCYPLLSLNGEDGLPLPNKD